MQKVMGKIVNSEKSICLTLCLCLCYCDLLIAWMSSCVPVVVLVAVAMTTHVAVWLLVLFE